MQRRLLVGGAVMAAATAVVVGIVLARGGKETPRTTPRPEETRHYLINLSGLAATVGRAAAPSPPASPTSGTQLSGVLRIRTGRSGGVEAVSLDVGSLPTARGPSGPVSVALAEGGSSVTLTGSRISATFQVELLYPLLYEVGGESVSDDVVVPAKRHLGQATFEGDLSGTDWDATLTITPTQLPDTDFNLPELRAEVRTPVLFETPRQLARGGGGGVRVHCIDPRPERGAMSDQEVAGLLRELRGIWRAYGAVLLTPDEVSRLNTAIQQAQVSSSQTRDPQQVPSSKCYVLSLVRANARGGGITADAARRQVTVGANARQTCPGTTLGRLAAHALGHLFLRLDTDEQGRGEDNLMRRCAPGTQLDDEQRARHWSFVAEVSPELTAPGAGALANVSSTELLRLADQIAGGVTPTLSPSPTRSPTPSPRRTPTPTRRRSPSPTPTPTRSPSPRPSPTASPTPSPSPTGSPTPPPSASPTPTSSTP